MDINTYLFGVLAAALLTAVLSAVAGKDGTSGAGVRFLCGLYLLLCVVNPWKTFAIDDGLLNLDAYREEANRITEDAAQESAEAMSKVIKDRVEAYILDKAADMGAKLQVEVQLDVRDIPVPVGVSLRGSISPYGKDKLSQMIQNDLGISVEAQKWS